jgi:type III pantothenate kinase
MTATVLLLDIGNSRVKWALVQPPEWFADGACPHDETDTLLREWDRFPAPEKVIASNVAGEERARLFSTYWQARDVPLHWMQPPQASSGVRNLYDRPEQLGSDRWAALVGAWSSTQGACLVVSAGTAVTVDALNKQGEFIGGLILPGRHLMLKSLAAGTHALDELAGQAMGFPRNTADAIASGAATALASAIEKAFQRLASISATPPACILTGGDAEWLANHFQIGAIIAPRLVLEGLLIMAMEDDQT